MLVVGGVSVGSVSVSVGSVSVGRANISSVSAGSVSVSSVSVRSKSTSKLCMCQGQLKVEVVVHLCPLYLYHCFLVLYVVVSN